MTAHHESGQQIVDLIIRGGTIITMDAERRIIEDGALCIDGSRIIAVEKASSIEQRYDARNQMDARDKVIMPGLINTHVHLFQTFLRGVGQDLPAIEWLHTAIDPVVGRLTAEDSYLSALLGCVEGIKSGTTCLVEYNYANPHPDIPDAVIDAFRDAGIRGVLARGILDTGDLHRDVIHDTDSELAECERLIGRWNGADDGMLAVWIAPYTIMSASAEAFHGARTVADRWGVRLTVHAATPSTIEASIAQYGMGDLQWEDSIGFLGPDVLLVHCCGELTPDDLAIIRRRGAQVSHNPASNCYLGEGIAPIRDMLQKGIPVGLATDGPSSNNNLDMVATVKLAGLLQKVKYLDPSAVSAYQLLEMATIGGAAAVGMASEIGSLEVNKRADLVILDIWQPNCVAIHDPVAALAYSATQESVDTVLINGRIVMRDRRLLGVKEADLLRRSQRAARDLLERAGL